MVNTDYITLSIQPINSTTVYIVNTTKASTDQLIKDMKSNEHYGRTKVCVFDKATMRFKKIGTDKTVAYLGFNTELIELLSY